MVEDKADDPVDVIRAILAAGPVPAPEFRRLAHEQGVPVKEIPKAAKAAGAECRRLGRPGEGGWIWALTSLADQGIVTRKGRKGFYAKFMFHGKEIQQWLADDLDTARARLVELKADLEHKRAANPPQRRQPSPREKREVKALSVQLRELARELLAVCGRVRKLENSEGKP